MHILDQIGGYEDVELIPSGTTWSKEGNAFYAFRQVSEGTEVSGSGVKLVTDSEGKAIGLNSTLIPEFSGVTPDGETYDVVAHEFTHGVTGKNVINTVGINDYGAIDESMSDIMGNLIESLLGKTKDKTWLIAENGIKPMRSMSDPHKYAQPEFVWDKYYVPKVREASGANDIGGVHTNASLLSLIAYRLNESGMDQMEQFNFWMNVSYMLTPRTDYEQMAELLPWALSLVGHDEYMDVLAAAIEESRIADRSLPDEVCDDLARFVMYLEDPVITERYDLFAVVQNLDTLEIFAYEPDSENNVLAVTVDPGRYVLQIEVTDRDTGDDIILQKTADGWMGVTDLLQEEIIPDMTEGDVLEIGGGGMLMLDPEDMILDYFFD